MLFRVDLKERRAVHVERKQLKSFGYIERDLQEVLFRSLDRLLPDEELLVISQSKAWQEEADILATDEAGRLYIFELKVWESQSANLLQVLRYGQLFGSQSYEELNRRFQGFDDSGRTLAQAHSAAFGGTLDTNVFNRSQVFVVMTNGLDFRTREAIQYWRSSGLDVRPWVYRVYTGDGESFLLEISRFAVSDNPYEDVDTGYYILNTNFSNNQSDHEDMLGNRKAAAYFRPWKNKIEQLSRGDTVFLYQSGVGIVAVGRVAGKMRKVVYHGSPEHQDEEYYVPLNKFRRATPPLPAAMINALTGRRWPFRGTMFSIDLESGRLLEHEVAGHSAK